MKTETTRASSNPATRFTIVAAGTALTALVILPAIAAAGNIEEGSAADVLFLIQVLVAVIAIGTAAMAIRARQRSRRRG